MTNAGWSFVALTEDELAAADEETAIRGFKIEKKAQKVLNMTLSYARFLLLQMDTAVAWMADQLVRGKPGLVPH